MDFTRWHHLRNYVSQFVRRFPQSTDRQTNGHIDRQKITCCLMSDMVLCSEWTSPGDTIWGTDRQTDRHLPVVWCQTWCSVENGLHQVTPSEALRQSVRPTFSSEVQTDRQRNGHIDRQTITCCLMSDMVLCREWTSPGDTIWGTTSVSSSDIFLKSSNCPSHFFSCASIFCWKSNYFLQWRHVYCNDMIPSILYSYFVRK